MTGDYVADISSWIFMLMEASPPAGDTGRGIINMTGLDSQQPVGINVMFNTCLKSLLY